MSLTVRDVLQFLSTVNGDAPIESVLKFRHVDGAIVMELSGAQFLPTTPQPKKRGVEYATSEQQIEGVDPNASLQSWCWHTDTDVTVEILQTITVPLQFACDLSQLAAAEQQEAILRNVGTSIFQALAAIGFHSADVERCQKAPETCRHRQAS